MGRRSVSVAAAAAILILTGGLAGCGSDRVHEETVLRAESGVAIKLEDTAARTADLLAARGGLSEVTEEDIVATFINDLRPRDDSSPTPVEKRGVFDIVENADGTVTFSVFVGSSAYGAGGLVTTNQSRHSCGTITGRFTERTVKVGDLDCPLEIASFAGEDSIAVSMTGNAEKHGVQVEEAP